MLLRRDSKQGKTNAKSGGECVAEGPVAYIATVVRNVDTFNCFVKAAAYAKLSVLNITSDVALANFLPYMLSFDRSSVQLLRVTSLS
jgi:protein-lysine N-methyltransferase EEF2KMT